MVKNQLKIYGTRKRGHREHWTVKGKGVYREVRRDKKGRIVSAQKWGEIEPEIVSARFFFIVRDISQITYSKNLIKVSLINRKPTRGHPRSFGWFLKVKTL
jgi:hypothetical protein